MAIKDPIVRRDDGIRSGVLGVGVLVLVVTIGLSERPLVIGNMPDIIAGESATATRPDAVRIIDEYGVHVLKLRHRPLLYGGAPVAALTEPDPEPNAAQPLRFGYSLIETDILGMPFWVRRDMGPVLFYEQPRDFVAVEANAYNLKSMGVTPKVPVAQQGFAWWGHLWGWLFVASAAGYGLFELGATRRRREAEGMI